MTPGVRNGEPEFYGTVFHFTFSLVQNIWSQPLNCTELRTMYTYRTNQIRIETLLVLFDDYK